MEAGKGELNAEPESSTELTDSTEKERVSTAEVKYIYMIINIIAVIIHVGNTVSIGILQESHFKHIKQGYVFVSPIAELDWTNHALIKVSATDNKCYDVKTSPQFISTMPSSPSSLHSPFPPRVPYPNFLKLFDFTNTTLVTYNIPGNELHLNYMMMFFCMLSAIFQTIHGVTLYYYEGFPRVLHYIEYAFSSPLMVMVMAVNVGIREMFLVTSLAGLFFGMNMVGMCAEAMIHYAGHIEKESQTTFLRLCSLAHTVGWILFMLAMVPIWAQFNQVLLCSENRGTPAYAYAAIVIESLLFFLFGFLQLNAVWEKLWYVATNTSSNKNIPASILFKHDCFHAILSVTAKTMLAWLLLGPALSVTTDNLT